MKTHKEKGQSLVELALTLTFLLFLLAGATEFGIVFFQYVQMRDAVQEGALYGSMFPEDETGIRVRTLSASSQPMNLNRPDVIFKSEVLENGKAIKVSLVYEHKIIMPFIPQLLGREYITLDAFVVDTILR